MEDYRSNSNKSKEAANNPPKPPDKPETKKKEDKAPLITREDIKGVEDYIWHDVIGAAVKKGLSEIAANGLKTISNFILDSFDLFLYKGEKKTSRRDSNGQRNYRGMFKGEESRDEYRRSAPRVSGNKYDNIYFDTRAKADKVLEDLDELISVYDKARVADLYDIVGITDFNYPANNYGWTNLATASVVREEREGKLVYLLKLPRPVPLR